MEIVSVIPDNREHWLAMRSRHITSTEVSALFGLNPYFTKFELWHRKKENITVEFEANERTLWGNRLETAIAEGSAAEDGTKIRKADEYVFCEDLRIGSSFDFMIVDEIKDEGGAIIDLVDKSIMEIKNVDSLVFKEGWAIDDDGNIEAPTHIEIQVQQQMILKPHVKNTQINALVGGNRRVKITREPNPEMQQMIKDAVAEFWKSIDENNPPAPDFMADLDTLKKLYETAEPGKVINADERVTDLAKEYDGLGKTIKSYQSIRDGVKAELLTLIGDAEKVLGEGFSISAGTRGPSYIEAHTRAGFRDMRVFMKKGKKDDGN